MPLLATLSQNLASFGHMLISVLKGGDLGSNNNR